MIRYPTPPASPRAGIRAGGSPADPSHLPQLAHGPVDLRQLGLELAARGRPFVDLPRCLGGTSAVHTPEAADTSFIKSTACRTCPFDEQCPGAPLEALDAYPTAAVEATLRPLPVWYSFGRPPRVLILSSSGSDLVLYASTLPALAEALRRRGATVRMVSPWASCWNAEALPSTRRDARFAKEWDDLMSQIRAGKTPRVRRRSAPRDPCRPDWTGTSGVEAWLATHDLSGFDLVIVSDFATARVVLRAGRLGTGARLVVLDFHMLEGMDDVVSAWVTPPARPAAGGWWPSDQLIVESAFPGYVGLYLNYGIPLEHVSWRPFSLYPGHFPPGPDVNECCVIMSGGVHLRDHETLRAATARLAADVHPVVLCDRGRPLAGNAHLLPAGEVSLRSFYHAIAHSRFVVLPLREDATRAAGVAVLAMALMAGRPVVATGITAIRDYVQHGAEALLVPPGDPAALADAMTRLDADPVLLSALAAGARTAGQRLSTETWAEDIISATARTPVWTRFGWDIG